MGGINLRNALNAVSEALNGNNESVGIAKKVGLLNATQMYSLMAVCARIVVKKSASSEKFDNFMAICCCVTLKDVSWVTSWVGKWVR